MENFEQFWEKFKSEFNNGRRCNVNDFIEGLTVDHDEYFYGTDFFVGDCTDERPTWNGVAIEFVEQDGGGEGGAEDCYTVLKVLDGYIKIEYSYHSYSGFNFDYATVKPVKPVERMVTFYE